MFNIPRYVGPNENYIILEPLPYKGELSQYKRGVKKGAMSLYQLYFHSNL